MGSGMNKAPLTSDMQESRDNAPFIPGLSAFLSHGVTYTIQCVPQMHVPAVMMLLLPGHMHI